ncbi:hypothetical protein K438DRAFT_1971121 [Mycena galopus ATCC 62051]|nr:hypothetical protein K438DRAFT_1971121 [Mycena galopus ATCC 62051]
MSTPSSPSGEPPPLHLPPVSAPSPPSGEPVPPAELLPVLLASATSSPSGEPLPLPLPPASAPSPPSGKPVLPAEQVDEMEWGGIQDDDEMVWEDIILPGSRPLSPVMDDIEEPWGGISEPAPMLSAPPKKSVLNFGSDDEGTLPEVNGLTTWASRNPRKPVQHPHERPKWVIGPEWHCTLQDKLKNKKGRTAALNADLAELNKERNAKVAELAAKHKFKVPLVQQRLYGA